ncbi:cytochrome-b5 reductase [Gymnopus androsaceus JB14]|uniref:cytochrome-b5 reductase n=1 Tax=Gymnopus androsaceus JB14 TaxID=1447944 RepID=A0A6A4HTB0_9AGAR|nr:cytochrome-b5 reductase [Gymnopus androsaceus JB14]
MISAAATRHFGTQLLRTAARRSYATAPTPKERSSLPLYLVGASIAGLGGYYYLNQSGKTVALQEKSPLDPENFKDFKLKKIVPYNHNTSEFIFELPNNEASLLPVASCLVVKSSDPEALKDDKGKPIIRPYTPVSDANHKGELTLLIKKYETGVVSKHIHSLKGDTLAIQGPYPTFPYTVNEFDEIALIGGGSGMQVPILLPSLSLSTPLYQIITHALSNASNRTKFTLLFSNVTEADILLKSELEALKKKYPTKFDVVYVLDNPPPSWTGASGYVSKEIIQQHIAPASLAEKVKVFVCGPPGQVTALAGKKAGMKQGELGGILKELGYTEDQVHKF